MLPWGWWPGEPGRAAGSYTVSVRMAECELGELVGLPLSVCCLSGALSHQAVNATHNRPFLLGC